MTAAADARPLRARPPADQPRGAWGLKFFREFFRSPGELGTCFTSSRSLSRAMVSGLDLARASAVIELGPGTGPVTREILDRVPAPPVGRFFVVERNAELAASLRARFPGLRVYCEDAVNLAEICRSEGLREGEVDHIISGLPFALFPRRLELRILRAAAAMLREGGDMTILTYRIEGLSPSIGRFKETLRTVFSRVRRHKVVLANAVPASVYRCWK